MLEHALADLSRPIGILDAATDQPDLQANIHSPIVCRCSGLPTRFVDDIDRLTIEGDRGFAERRDAGRAGLWELTNDPRFMDCLATQAPEACLTYAKRSRPGRTPKRNSYYRGLERGLYRFVARFCTRNDTTGTAGSTFWGTFVPDQPADVLFTPGTRRLATRRVYASPRHASALLLWLGQSALRDDALVTVAPRMRLIGETLLRTDAHTFATITPAQVEILRRCMARPTRWNDVAAVASLDALESLFECGAVIPVLAAPWTGGLDGRLRQASDAFSAADPVQDGVAEMRALVRELLDLQDRLHHLEGSEFAHEILRADAMVGALTAQRVDSQAAAIQFLEWMFTRGPVTSVPLELSRRYELTDSGELFDRRTGTRAPVAPVLAECLRVSLGERRSLARVIVERCGPAVRGELWELFEGGLLALDDVDPVDTQGHHLNEFTHLYLERIARLPTVDARVVSAASILARPAGSPSLAIRNRAAVEAALATLKIPVKRPPYDRHFFVVDSARDVERFAIGGELGAAMRRDLGTVLKLFAWQTYVREKQVLRRLSRILSVGSSVPLLTALRAVAETRPPSTPRRGSRVDEDGRWCADAPRIRCQSDDGAAIVQIEVSTYPEEFERWFSDKRLVSTIDLMLGPARSGAPRLILNEAHTWGSGLPETTMFPMVQPEDRVRECLPRRHAEAIFDDRATVIPIETTKQSDGILSMLAGLTVAVDSPTTWSDPRSTVIPLGELDLHRDDTGYYVADRGMRKQRLISSQLCTGSVRLVGNELETVSDHVARNGAFQPRNLPYGARGMPGIRIGDLLVARASVLVPVGRDVTFLHEAVDEQLVQAGRRLREQWGLPRRVFVAIEGEKPFYCDLESCLSLEVLAHELRKCRRAVRITEMMPSFEDLWLEFGDGSHTSELRFVATLDGPRYTAKDLHLRAHRV